MTSLQPVLTVGFVLCAAGLAPAGEITLESLLNEMTDLDRLTRFPDPPYTCIQASSYDRAAKSPTENWFANADRGQFLRQEKNGERTEYVLMDAAGPGAIVRIWSANPQGTLRFYLDHASEPALEVSMADWLQGKVPFNPVPIAGVRARGQNSFLPIPYSKHCKVTNDAHDFYYHVNYRTYAKGTAVRTFTREQAEKNKDLIDRIARELASPRATSGPSRERRLSIPVTLEPGASRTIRMVEGPRVIVVFRLFKLESPDLEEALRRLVLTITADGEETVMAPAGDFFGSAPGVAPYESLPLGMVTGDAPELWSHWRMPFQREAEIRFENRSKHAVSFRCAAAADQYAWDDRSMHFHAKWRNRRGIPTEPKSDMNFMEVTGTGVFVGAAQYIANPNRIWWGEGDEKIYVDGESFPSHFGTGTEDYFGYAWGSPELFAHAYHNQPRCDGPANYGHTAVNRWHIIDDIPFTEQFKFDMELWHWRNCRVDVGSICYWYARPGATDNFEAPTSDQLQVRTIKPYAPPRVAGALEGEDFRVIHVDGQVRPQDIANASNEKHMWWTNNKPGDKLVLGFNVDKAGRYRVRARFLMAIDYGISRITINNQTAPEPVDLFNDGIKLSDELDLGITNLSAGENLVMVEVVGKNDKSTNYMFGLDYLLLKPPSAE
jgi:hypothetical protein